MRYSSIIRQAQRVLNIQSSSVSSFKIMTADEYEFSITHSDYDEENPDPIKNRFVVIFTEEGD